MPADPKQQPLLPKSDAPSDDDPQPVWTPQGSTPPPPGHAPPAAARAAAPAAAAAASAKPADKQEPNPFADDEHEAGAAPSAAAAGAAAGSGGCKPCPTLNAEVLLLLPDTFQFTPLLCNDRARRWAQHRWYYPVAFLVVLVYLLLLFQSWLGGWVMFGLLLAYALFLITPIVLCECTRMDRFILGRLMRNFEWGWLFLNFLAVQCFDVMLFRAQPSTSADELARMVLGVGLLFWCCLYSFSLDALVGGRPLFKGLWITIFLLQTGYTWYRVYFGGGDSTVDVTFGSFSATNMQAGCLLTVAAWEAKLVVSLIRHPRGLMMLGAQYVLTEQKAAPVQVAPDRNHWRRASAFEP